MVASFDLIFGNQHQRMDPNYFTKFVIEASFPSSLSATARKWGNKGTID